MKITQYLIILLLPVTIILSNLLYLAYRSNIYESIYIKENIYQHFQSKAEVDNAIKELIGYFRGQNSLEDKLFSYQAEVHLEDVKTLFQTAFFINIFLIFFLMLTILYFIKNNKLKPLKKSIIIGSSITLCIAIIVAISITINFDFIFIKFHELSFNNNYWLFDKSDNLIKLFPPEFFISFAKKLYINILLTVFILIIIMKLFIKHDKFSI